MTPLTILACDPGTTRCGHARIVLHRDRRGGRFIFSRGGHRELDRGWLHAELQQLREEGGVFALEVLIGGRFRGRMTASLNETARMEGRILDIADGAGWPMPPRDPLPLTEQKGEWVLLIPAGDGTIKRGKTHTRILGWRGELCHTSRPSNATIRVCVEGIVEQIPHLHHLAREHVLDAAGLGVVACHRFLGQQVRLPMAVEQALLLQRMADKAKPKRQQTRLYSRSMRQKIGDGVRAAKAAR